MTSSTDDSRASRSWPRGTSNGTRFFCERPLRTHDPLRDRRLGDEKRARNLVGRQPAEQPQRQRRARLCRQDRMARGEDEPQQIVADIFVHRRFELARDLVLTLFELVSQLLVFAIEQLAATEVIDRTMFGGGHQPGAGIPRNSGFGPLLQRGHERVVRQIFGKADVAHDSRKACDDLRRFDAPDRIDRAVGVRSRMAPILHVMRRTEVLR